MDQLRSEFELFIPYLIKLAKSFNGVAGGLQTILLVIGIVAGISVSAWVGVLCLFLVLFLAGYRVYNADVAHPDTKPLRIIPANSVQIRFENIFSQQDRLQEVGTFTVTQIFNFQNLTSFDQQVEIGLVNIDRLIDAGQKFSDIGFTHRVNQRASNNPFILTRETSATVQLEIKSIHIKLKPLDDGLRPYIAKKQLKFNFLVTVDGQEEIPFAINCEDFGSKVKFFVFKHIKSRATHRRQYELPLETVDLLTDL